MISLTLLLALLGLVPAVSGVILILGARALSRLVAAIWCGVVLLFSLVAILLLIRLLTYGDTIQATAFAPAGWSRWLQLSYQVDSFNIFSALVVGVLASAGTVVLIAFEPAHMGQQQDEQHTGQQRDTWQQSRIWQMGILLIALGATLTAIFANSALWMVAGWGLAGLCAFALFAQGQPRRHAIILLATPCLAAIILYLSLLPAISTLDDKRLDLLNGLERQPFWAACIMLAALLAPGVVLLTQQAIPASAARPAGMRQNAIYVLMVAPVTFTVLARLAPLIAGPGVVTPGGGAVGWRAFSLVIVWAGAALALAAALLAMRSSQRSTLPIFLSIQLLSWLLAAIAITGTAALNGALLFKLLRFLALGALLLAGERRPAQPILNMSWWLAAFSLSILPFSAGFSSAWLITSGAVAAGPAWVAGIGVNWLALLLVTLAIARTGSAEHAPAAEASRLHITNPAEALPSFLLFLLALLALVLGIAPEVAVNFFTGPAANALPVIASQTPGAGIQTNPLGLVSATGTWSTGLFWLLALLLLLLCFFLTRQTRQPASVPSFMGGEAKADHTDEIHRDSTKRDGTIAPSPLRAEQSGEPERSLESEPSPTRE
jgi:formate hydrogenlyase subunit 3/multisubunit Na+/H+ antiporter MnhD subunit